MSAHLPHRPVMDRPEQEALWREVLGRRLRALRLRRRATLADVRSVTAGLDDCSAMPPR